MLRSATLFVSMLACTLHARAEEYGAVARHQRKLLVATHGEDATASGTAIEVSGRTSLPRSLGDLVREAPGTRVIGTGGMGAFSSLSLRGADGEETLVLLDEIPLLTPDGGAFDLSLFPAELFERVEVFRGGAPVWLGSGAIGGVLRLVPRRELKESANAGLAAGSFGTYQLHGGAAVGSTEGVLLRAHMVARDAHNDFPYTDDRGTRATSADDIELRRKNAQLSDATGIFDLTLPLLGGTLHLIALANGRTGGFSGPASAPTPNVHRQSQRALVGLSYERRAGGGARSPRRRIQLVASGSASRGRYTDLFGELGVTARSLTRDLSYRGFARLAASVRIVRWLEATLVSSYALDRYDWNNRFAYPKLVPSTRHTAAAALELAARGSLGKVGFELRPSARLEWSHTRLDADRGLSGEFDPVRKVLLPSGRIGFGVSPHPDVALTTSLAVGGRLPTMFELFGDRATTLPSPGLKPVTSRTLDGGVTWCTTWEHVRTSLELRGFAQKRRDMIAPAVSARSQVSYRNVSEVTQSGAELGLFGALYERLFVHAALTYLHTETELHKRLPLRPTWVLFARPELRTPIARGPVSSAALSAEIAYRSFVFSDPANLVPRGDCRTAALSASAGFWRERLRFTGRVDDVADVRCTDLQGYPLPGRSLFFTLSYQQEST